MQQDATVLEAQDLIVSKQPAHELIQTEKDFQYHLHLPL
jgi:hypothetical protein